MHVQGHVEEEERGGKGRDEGGGEGEGRGGGGRKRGMFINQIVNMNIPGQCNYRLFSLSTV